MPFIRKFFWSTTLGAVLLIASSQMGGVKLLGLLTQDPRIVIKVAPSQEPTSRQVAADPVSRFAPVSEDKDKKLVKKEAGAEQVQYTINGKQYVYIEGKYYEARPDNIYMVNGQRVYYVNKRRAEPVQTASATLPNDSLPISTREMIERVKQAQQNIQERNDFLDELMRQRPPGD